MRSVTYTLAVAGAFERRTANEMTIPSATIVAPMAFIIIPSSVHSAYFELIDSIVRIMNKYFGSAYLNVKIAFSVRPVTHVAQASINVTSPKLAWIGTIAARQPYVAFSQHKHTKKLYITAEQNCLHD